MISKSARFFYGTAELVITSHPEQLFHNSVSAKVEGPEGRCLFQDSGLQSSF